MNIHYPHAKEDDWQLRGKAKMYALNVIAGLVGISAMVGVSIYTLLFTPHRLQDVIFVFVICTAAAAVTVYFERCRLSYVKERNARAHLYEFLCKQLLRGIDGVNWAEMLAQELRFGRPMYVVANELDQVFRDRYLAYVRQRYEEALRRVDDIPTDKRNKASGQKWVDEIAKFEQSHVGQMLKLGQPSSATPPSREGEAASVPGATVEVC